MFKEGLLSLIEEAPAKVKENIIQFSKNDEILRGKIELIVLFGSNGEVVKEKVQTIGGSFENLDFGFGIITVRVEDIQKIYGINEIQYIELPKNLFTSDIDANKESCIPPLWDRYRLSGKNVIVGFIDSGIDYAHPAFMDKNGKTRIEFIYDLSLGGKIWDNLEIDKALASPDPYSIVPHNDSIGHGTFVAGIACAGGNIDATNYGAAYESNIIMVKMTGEGNVNYGKSTQLMRGIKFIIDKSKEKNKPVVINLSFSTNDGAHDGKSLLEQYIGTVCNLEKITFVIAAGNEGNRSHHVGGTLKKIQNIQFSVGEQENTIIMQLYKDFISDIKVQLTNPSGNKTEIITISQGYRDGFIGNDRYIFYDSGPKPISLNGEIIISIVSEDSFLQNGLWTISILNEDENEGNYNIWLPISEGISDKTKFLQPNPYNTLGIPATVSNVISVGSYNIKQNSISSFSGRGNELLNPVKPDVVAPGENIKSTVPFGGFDFLTGTSMASPIVAGGCALLAEWGIVKGNDPYMYGERLKYYLLKGAIRERVGTKYPNAIFGYGKACFDSSMTLIQGGLRNIDICSTAYVDENLNNYIVEYEGDIKKEFETIDFACIFVLDENYAVLGVHQNRMNELLSKVKGIVYVEDSSIYILSSLSPIDVANINKFYDSSNLNLTGQGVLIGLIDTGIDYLNTEFMFEDDTTKIISIWDQSINDSSSNNKYKFGSEYKREIINEAIKINKAGGDPYALVPSKDEIGHGTEDAGIIGARGKNRLIRGAAPDSEFVVVKLKRAKESTLSHNFISLPECPVYDSTDILLAIKYVYEISRSLVKPMVIHVPLCTNKGGHDGSSLLERYISSIAKTRGLVTVVGTGNEGDSDIHTSGILEKSGIMKNIELNVDENERELFFEIWFHKPDKVSIGIVSPSGETIEKIPAKLKESEEVKFVFEGTIVNIQYLIPQEITGDELINISLSGLRGGIWGFNLYADYVVDGRYDAWLPQKCLLKKNTRFLGPNQYITISVPGTGNDNITAAFYNQNDNSVVPESGRGYTRDGRIKPDIAAGGINVLTTKSGGGTISVTGSSAGSSVTAGAVALMLEWGIVKGNDTTLYTTKIKAYLIRGTFKRPGDIYPNREWGYGALDLYRVFENIRSFRNSDNKSKIFIRMPWK